MVSDCLGAVGTDGPSTLAMKRTAMKIHRLGDNDIAPLRERLVAVES